MKLNEYLPKPSEYSDKVSAALEPWNSNLYLVGSAARKYLYGLPSNPEDYDVVVSQTGEWTEVEDRFAGMFGTDKVTEAIPETQRIVVDAETLTVKTMIQPIDVFLRNVLFAGDGMAIHVESGRVITLPEFITLPPMTPVRKATEGEAQIDPEYLKRHLTVLEKFTEEMINFKPSDEPTKS